MCALMHDAITSDFTRDIMSRSFIMIRVHYKTKVSAAAERRCRVYGVCAMQQMRYETAQIPIYNDLPNE